MSKRKIPRIGRHSARREPKRRFILFCEGKNTEPNYFSAIKRSWTSTLISIETHPAVGVPLTIARAAVKYARKEGLLRNSRRRRSSFEEKDEVWAVFDRDEHPNYCEAIDLCETHGIGVARSNPCFELWLVLHEADFNRPDDRHAVQKELEQLRPEYARQGRKIPDCDELVSRVMEAEGRAEKLLSLRIEEDNPHGCPSTTVGKLTIAIRNANQLAQRRE